MPIKIKSQKDYLLTEATLELPVDLVALEELLKAAKATGKIVCVYNQGGTLGVNVEQRTHIPEKISEEVRKIVGVGTRELEGK